MNIPFSTDQFLRIFALYNNAVWPLQILFNLAALLVLYAAARPFSKSNTFISAVLGFFWLWMGIVYHMLYFSAINPAAFVFGSVFVLQGLMFLWKGVLRNELQFRACLDLRGSVAGVLILYALLIYPLVGIASGHIYPQSPTFGLPCPTTIFTFGLLLWTGAALPKFLLIIPGVWSVIGFSAALSLGIREDIGLLVAGLLAISLLATRRRLPGTIPEGDE